MRTFEPLSIRELEDMYDRHDQEERDGVGRDLTQGDHIDRGRLLATVQLLQDRLEYISIRMSNAVHELDLNWSPEHGYEDKIATNGGYVYADPKIPILGEDDE